MSSIKNWAEDVLGRPVDLANFEDLREVCTLININEDMEAM